MDFKIGTVAKMTGLSPSGIRFLEDQGLLSPSGGRKGSYRSYSLSDVSKLLDYRNYRKCGISQDNILKLIAGNSDLTGKDVFEERCDELEERILQATRLLHFLRRRSGDVDNIARADSFWEVTQRPAMIWMPLRTTRGGYVEWPGQAGFDIPYTDSILLFDSAHVLTATGPVGAELGIGILESDVLKASFLDQKDVRYFRSQLSLHCIVEITESFCIDEAVLQRTAAFFKAASEQFNLKLSVGQSAISKRIITGNRGGNAVRYDDFWIDLSQEKC